MQVNPQNRQTGAAIAAHGVIRSGRGAPCPYRTPHRSVCVARTRFTTISAVRISPGRKRPMLPGGFEPMTAVYTSEDGTVYDSTDGWRIENYGSDKILAREVGGTLDAEIARGKSRTDILIASRDAIARLVRSGAKTRPPAVRRRPRRTGADDNLGCQERVDFVDDLRPLQKEASAPISLAKEPLDLDMPIGVPVLTLSSAIGSSPT